MASRQGAVDEFGTARRYAEQLLQHFGLAPLRPLPLTDEHPALSWAHSGLMKLTGFAEGAPLMCPAPIAACADGALAALAGLAPENSLRDLRGADLLAERAEIYAHLRRGAIAPGGSCRLLQTADGWLALNLAREEDWQLLPAWLEEECAAKWESVAAAVRARHAQELVARGRELGLALADSAPSPLIPLPPGEREDKSLSPLAGERLERGGACHKNRSAPRVLELASLWAGPLCGRLLRLCGAEVIKIESPARPDGARRGSPEFFERLNAGKQNLWLDLTAPKGRDQLLELIRSADIVIEGSRPRALRQLGIRAESLLAEKPGLTWLSITGHGRGEPQENWVAYGDDAAVAAGLSHLMHEVTGRQVFCGDAIADPLTGIHAALAAWAGWLGGGGLVSLSLSGVVSQCINFELPPSVEARRERQQRWTALAHANGLGC